jgi:hypothetical protein
MTKKTATPKITRQRTTQVAAPAPPSLTQQEIAARAFEYYCARGGQPGGELDDWLRAERELLATLVASRPRRSRGASSHT